MTRCAWPRRGLAAAVLWATAAAGLGAGCASVKEPTGTSTEQGFQLNVTALALVVGDSAVLAVSPVPLEPAVNGTVRWTSSRPDIVTIDSLVLIGEPAKVRARAAGAALLTGTIRGNGKTITAGVGVRVGAG